MQSYWLKLVIWCATYNHNTLFQSRVVTILIHLFMSSIWGLGLKLRAKKSKKILMLQNPSHKRSFKSHNVNGRFENSLRSLCWSWLMTSLKIDLNVILDLYSVKIHFKSRAWRDKITLIWFKIKTFWSTC